MDDAAKRAIGLVAARQRRQIELRQAFWSQSMSRDPNAGLHDVTSSTTSSTRARCLCVRVVSVRYRDDETNCCGRCRSPKSYVRGNDLVASYQPDRRLAYSPQLYWQANCLRCGRRRAGVVVALGFCADASARYLGRKSAVASQVPSDESLLVSMSESGHADAERDRCRHKQSPQRMTIAASYRDLALCRSVTSKSCRQAIFTRLRLLPREQARLAEWQLFADFLEKGVIRRARVHAAIVPREE